MADCRDKNHSLKHVFVQCANCMKSEPCRECRGAGATKFPVCARCKVFDKSSQCQKADWKTHKPRCSPQDEAEDREEAEAYRHFRETEGLSPSLHMSAVPPLLQRWIEIFRPLIILAALNAWGYVDPPQTGLPPKILDITVAAVPDISRKTKGVRAFRVEDAKPYGIGEYETLVRNDTWTARRESRQEIYEDYKARVISQRNRTRDENCRTSFVCITLDFHNGVFRQAFYKSFFFTDDRRRDYTEPAWKEADWLGFLKTNVAAGREWTREGLAL